MSSPKRNPIKYLLVTFLFRRFVNICDEISAKELYDRPKKKIYKWQLEDNLIIFLACLIFFLF